MQRLLVHNVNQWKRQNQIAKKCVPLMSSQGKVFKALTLRAQVQKNREFGSSLVSFST